MLTNRERHHLLIRLRGGDIESEDFVAEVRTNYENLPGGVIKLDRFKTITPSKFMMTFENVKQWWVHSNSQ
jgi:hypothetical protein